MYSAIFSLRLLCAIYIGSVVWFNVRQAKIPLFTQKRNRRPGDKTIRTTFPTRANKPDKSDGGPYLWQLEDLLRALQFSPEAVYSQLVQKQERLSEQQKQQALVWYMELAGLLREEGKEQSGHLEHTMHLIADLDNLHRQLLTLPAGENYRRLYGAVAPELPGLKSKLGKPGMSDVELFFRALYAVMLYRIKGDRSKQGYIDDVIGLISPVVAELATMFRRIERGEVDLFGDKKE